MANERTVIGAAGVRNVGHGDHNAARIISSMSMIQEGWTYKTLPKGTTQEVFTLDECLIAARREVFDEVRFDPAVCDGWHLYAAELCMQCHMKGIRVLVYDANIVHLSGGNMDASFFACERKIAKKYRHAYKLISYTCGWTYTNPIRYWILRWYRQFRYRIGK